MVAEPQLELPSAAAGPRAAGPRGEVLGCRQRRAAAADGGAAVRAVAVAPFLTNATRLE